MSKIYTDEEVVYELTKACDAYLLHLENATKEIMQAKFKTHYTYFFSPSRQILDKSDTRGMEGILLDSGFTKDTPELQEAIDKYKTIREMKAGLEQNGTPAKDKIESFGELVSKKYTQIASVRDTGFMKFVKEIANFLNIKKVRGQKLLDQVEEIQSNRPH